MKGKTTDLCTVNAFVAENGGDARTVKKYLALASIQPVRRKGVAVFYRMEDLERAVAAMPLSDDPSLRGLQMEQLALQNKRLRNKLAIEHDDWVPRSVAKQVFSRFVTEAKARSYATIARIVSLVRVNPD